MLFPNLPYHARRISSRPGSRYVDSPAERIWPFVFGGVIGPIVLTTVAVRWIAAGEVTLYDRNLNQTVVEGLAAIAAILAVLGGALFLHARFCWGGLRRWVWIGQLGELVGGIIAVPSGFYACFAILWQLFWG